MKNSKTNEPHIFALNLSQRLDLRISNNHNNSGELKYHSNYGKSIFQIKCFLQGFECSCTHFQAIMFSVNPQKSLSR